MSSASLSELVASGDLDGLVREVDRAADRGDWDVVTELRRRCLGAAEATGRQLWGPAQYAAYRLALEGPPALAASVVVPGAAPFALGPLTEVVAQHHTWADLAPHLDVPFVATTVAQERILRGEDLTGDPSLAGVGSRPAGRPPGRSPGRRRASRSEATRTSSRPLSRACAGTPSRRRPSPPPAPTTPAGRSGSRSRTPRPAGRPPSMPPTLHVWQGEPPGPRTVIRRTHEERPHVDPVTAHEERDDVQFLDVREPYEWDAGHIEGAVHIPMGELNARRDEIAEDRTVVAVCRSGARSSQVAQALVRAGYPAENLDGGMQAWERAGLPFVATDGSDGEVA